VIYKKLLQLKETPYELRGVKCFRLYKTQSENILHTCILKKFTCFGGNTRKVFSETEHGEGKSHKIDEKMYVQVNYTANMLLRYSRLVADKFELSEEISYEIKKQSSL